MGLLDKIKEESKKAGQSKSKFIYFRKDEKKRIRFLSDFEDGMEIVFHDSFEKGINVPCQEQYGRDCEYCEMEGLRTRNLYAWSVYDYDAKDVKILLQAVNNCTAVPTLMALYENYGTLLERDLVITKTGEKQSTTYTVVPQDKNTFRNSKAKALSEKAILKYLALAYPDENATDEDLEDDDEDEEVVKPVKKKKAVQEVSKKKSNKSVDEDDEEEDAWEDEEDDDEEVDYSSMSAKELYKLCKERDIKVLPKKPEKYYIRLLQEADKAHSDWEDEDGEEWEE